MTQKHNRSKRLGALLCAAVLIIGAGCSKTPGEKTPLILNVGGDTPQGVMGRWVEEPVALGGDYILFGAPTQLTDGTLRLYAQDSAQSEQPAETAPPLHQFDSTDGGASWSETPCRLNGTVLREIRSLCVAPGGGVLLYGYTISPDTKMQSHVLLYAPPNAAPQPVVFDPTDPLLQNDEAHPEPYALPGTAYPSLYPGQPQLQAIGFLSDTLAYACTLPFDLGDGTVPPDITFMFEPATAKPTAKVDGGLGYSQGTLYGLAASPDSLHFLLYNAAGDATLVRADMRGAISPRMSGLKPVNATCLDGEGNYYYANETGIFRVAAGGTLSELVVESTGFSFSSEDKFLPAGGLLYASNGSFFVAIKDKSDYAIHSVYRYRFDKTQPALNETELTLWSLTESPSLRAGIIAFRTQHPEISVSYTIGMPEGQHGLTAQDVLRTLNTELLAGQGPDVLLLDGMDASAYLSKGLLVDLSAQVDADALVPFVKRSYYKPGETFVLPARFSVPIVCGPAQEIAAMTTPDALESAVLSLAPRPVMDCMSENYYDSFSEDERYALGFYSIGQLVQFALQASAPALIENGAVNTDAVSQLLGFIEAVGKHSSMSEYAPTFVTNGSVSTMEENPVWHDGGQEFLLGNAVYGWDVVQTPAYLAATGQTVPETGQWLPIGFRVQPGLVRGAYLPGTMLSVSAASKQPELALAFVKAMLGEAVQAGFYEDGMSVLQSRLDASIATTCTEKRLEHYNVQTAPQALFESLQTPVVVDTQVRQSVTVHATALVKGEESLAQAVAGVEHELSLSLAERG